MKRIITFMLAAASLFVATAAQAQTIDAWLKGHYGSTGDLLCNSGVVGFNTPYGCGVAPSSNAPTASGYVLCGGGPLTASFTDAVSCGFEFWKLSGSNVLSTQNPMLIDATASTNAAPAVGGFYMTGGTQTSRFYLTDSATMIQAAWGDRIQIVGYHGIAIYGGVTGVVPAPEAGGGSGDWGLEVHAGGSKGLKVDGSVQIGSSGTAISSTYAATASFTSSVGPQTCTTLATIAVPSNPGAAQGSVCAISATNATSSTTWNAALSCGVTTANTVIIRACNPSTATVTFSSVSIPFRVFNP